jgi:hypothetical protein
MIVMRWRWLLGSIRAIPVSVPADGMLENTTD